MICIAKEIAKYIKDIPKFSNLFLKYLYSISNPKFFQTTSSGFGALLI